MIKTITYSNKDSIHRYWAIFAAYNLSNFNYTATLTHNGEVIDGRLNVLRGQLYFNEQFLIEELNDTDLLAFTAHDLEFKAYTAGIDDFDEFIASLNPQEHNTVLCFSPTFDNRMNVTALLRYDLDDQGKVKNLRLHNESYGFDQSPKIYANDPQIIAIIGQ